MKKIICAFIAMAISVGLSLYAYADDSFFELDNTVFNIITSYADAKGVKYSEEADGFYCIDYDTVTFISAVTGNTKQIYVCPNGVIKSVYSDDNYIYLVYRVYTTSSEPDECHIIKIDMAFGNVETIMEFDSFVTAAGVDDSGRLYIATNEKIIYIYSRSGELLTQVTAPETVYNFVAFDSDTGNFFFAGYYNWIYWGYDHSMNALYAGNYNGSTAVVEEFPYQLIYQNGYAKRLFATEECDDKYILIDNTFNSQLQILDMEKYVVNSEENALTMTVSRDNTDPETGYYDEDAASGPRAVYNKDKNSIITYNSIDNSIVEYSLDTGKEISRQSTDHSVYLLSKCGDTIVAIEKDKGDVRENDRYYVAKMPWIHVSKISLNGKSTINVGEKTTLNITADGTVFGGMSYSSSDTTVATVTEDGTVYGWNNGTATITATTGNGCTAQFRITVVGNSSVITPDNPATKNQSGAITNNDQNNESYSYYGSVIDSYISEDLGIITRVENTGENVIIEQYTSSLATLSSKKTIDYELPIFGGCYFGAKFNYLVFGKINETESDEEEVIRVVKYDKNWKRLSSQSIKGANTYIPFDAGSLSMTETDEFLYIHTCHEMYASDDGLHHQANMTFKLNISDMSVVDSWYDVMNVSYGYVSHSFNQFIATDGEYIYRLDHGDAYPRSVVLTKCRIEDSITRVSYASLFKIEGSSGRNYTGVTLGGLALSDETCIAVGNSIDQNNFNESKQRNVFISIMPSNFSENAKVIYLTDHAEGANITIGTPQIIEFAENGYLVMWEEIAGNEKRTAFVTIDKYGNIITEKAKTELLLSDCRPIVLENGLVCWYVTKNSSPIFYQVNPYDLDAIKLKVSPASGLKVTSSASDTLVLSWNKISDADGYFIEQYKNNNWVKIATITGNATTSYRVSSLTGSTTYKFRVCGYKSDSTGAIYGKYSPVLSATTKSVTITGFGNTAKYSNRLVLSWNKNTSADGYKIQQMKNGVWTTIKDITNNATTSYTVTGLAPSTLYTFRAIAYELVNNSYHYGSFTASMSAITLPSTVTGLGNIQKTSDSLTLSWNKNTSADGYKLQQMKNGTWTTIATITSNATTSYKVTGLASSTTYYFRMIAYKNAYGNTYYSAFTDKLPTITLPSNITGFINKTKYSDRLVLSWNKNTSADGYKIQQMKNGSWTTIKDITSNATTSYTVTGLVPSTTYYFRMIAYNNEYGNTYYSSFTGNLSAITLPGAVVGFTTSKLAPNSLTFSWSKNSSADGYKLQQMKNGVWVTIKDIASNTTTSYTATGLSPATTYNFRMIAYNNEYGNTYYSAFTDNLSATTRPSDMQNFRVGGKTASVIRLNWDKNTTAHGYIIEQYKDGKWERVAKLVGNETTTYRVTGLASNTTYKFRMKAYIMAGNVGIYSALSSTISVATDI